MRQHQPQHLAALQNLWSLPPAQAYASIAIDDYKDPNYVPSEVLAMLVRSGSSHGTPLREAATAALNRRVLSIVHGLIRGVQRWSRFGGREVVVEDAVQTVFLKLLSNPSVISNSEVCFAVFVKDRTTDYIRSLTTRKASSLSYDALASPDQEDEDGRSDSFFDTVADPAAITPEEFALRRELHARVEATYLGLPRMQRLAIYFRLEYGPHLERELEWEEVAKLMECSVPTARKHYRAGVETLMGEM